MKLTSPETIPARRTLAGTEITSRDGARLVVRPMRRSDAGALAHAVASLSAESRYRRFLTPKPRLARREIAALTDLDGHARVALIALDPATGEWVAVAPRRCWRCSSSARAARA
jgi:hypothetical protein